MGFLFVFVHIILSLRFAWIARTVSHRKLYALGRLFFEIVLLFLIVRKTDEKRRNKK